LACASRIVEVDLKRGRGREGVKIYLDVSCLNRPFDDQDQARIRLTAEMFKRAEAVQKLGIKPADALHVAAAEHAEADVLLSCDDRLCKAAQRHHAKLRIEVQNPLTWLNEVENADDS
jgi:PIN domain